MHLSIGVEHKGQLFCLCHQASLHSNNDRDPGWYREPPGREEGRGFTERLFRWGRRYITLLFSASSSLPNICLHLTDRTSSQAENFFFQSLAPLLCFSCYYYLRSCSHSCLLCQQGFKFSVSTTDFHQLESWTITREISTDLEEEKLTDKNEHWQPGFLSKNKTKNECMNK